MEIAGISVVEITQLLTLLGVVFMIMRGIVTKKDCEKCKTETEGDFKAGRREFKEVRQVQADHGEQLAGIGSTVTAMSGNVDKLVQHHIGGSE